MSCFCGARGYSHIEGEGSIGPIELAASPADGSGFFGLNLLPHTSAVGAFEAEVVKISGGREFERRVTLLFEFDAANSTGGQALRHELEFVAVLDIASDGGRVEFGFDAKKVGIGLGEMFRRKIRGKEAADIFESEFEEAWRDSTAKEGADFVRQFAKAKELIVVPVRSALEFVAIRMHGSELGKELAQLNINRKWSSDGRVNE